jgi:hypothetical protein
MFADSHDDDIVVDASNLSFRSAPSIDACVVQLYSAAECRLGVRSNPRPLAFVSVKNHLQDRTSACKSSGRDPPQAPTSRWSRGVQAWVRSTATNASARSFARREFAIGNAQSLYATSRHIRRKAEHSGRPATWLFARDSARRSDIGEAVCPDKADMFSGSQSHRRRSQEPS